LAQCYPAGLGMVRPGMAWLWVAVLGTLSLVFVCTLNIYLPQSSAAEVGVQADLAASPAPPAEAPLPTTPQPSTSQPMATHTTAPAPEPPADAAPSALAPDPADSNLELATNPDSGEMELDEPCFIFDLVMADWDQPPSPPYSLPSSPGWSPPPVPPPGPEAIDVAPTTPSLPLTSAASAETVASSPRPPPRPISPPRGSAGPTQPSLAGPPLRRTRDASPPPLTNRGPTP